MAKCAICGKKAMAGMKVARTGTRGFIKKRSKRRFKPNIRTVRVKLGEGTKKLKVCAKCLKSVKRKGQSAKLPVSPLASLRRSGSARRGGQRKV